MVKSILRPNDINYKETKTMDEEDIDHASTLYEYPLYGHNLTIALGKEKYTYSSYNIVYYPIYLIVLDEPKSKIGVFEVESNQVINIIDDDGDVILEKGNIIIYASDTFINKLLNETDELEQLSRTDDLFTDKPEELNIDIIDLTEDPPSVLDLHISKEKKDKLIKSNNDVFESAPSILPPPLLEEESEEDSKELKEQYKETSKTNWLQKFMKNNLYSIIDNEGGGDCFFAVLRDAFKQIGKITTVDKLRKLLSKEATEEQFKQYRVLYTNFLAELQDKEAEMKAIKKMIPVLKKRSDTTSNKEEHKQILGEAKSLTEKYNRLKLERDDTKDLMKEFDYMKEITDLEKFRDFILRTRYWADTWAISTLEKLLNIKVIILSEEAFEYGDLDSVLNCGQLNDSELEKEGNFNPDFYIITCYTGNHYKLISYKEKRILKFREIPYDIKVMVINKCMERNAGPYYLVEDFRKLKNSFGLDADEGGPKEPEDEYLNKDVYDKNIVFMFHANSNSAPKAGKGSGEKLEDMKLTDFNMLNKNKDWRKKLDDSWIAPITIDNHRWNCVEHYYLGSQFKKGFPDFYLQFSLDSNSDIGKDINLARAAAGKTGKLKDRVLRDNAVKIDSDFFEVGLNPRNEETRYAALVAKFNQNLDLKSLLLETKMAKLVHFMRGKEPEPDNLLMRVRKELSY